MDFVKGTGSKFVADAGSTFLWAYVVFSGLAGIAMVSAREALPAACWLGSAVLALPPTAVALRKRLGGVPTISLLFACTIGLIFSAFATTKTIDVPSKKAEAKPEAQAFVPSQQAIALVKLLLLDDFRGYLVGSKTLGEWSEFYPVGQRVTASQLYTAYHANEVSADDKFRDKSLLVSGSVESINKDFLDSGYLSLLDGNEFENVHAKLSDESMRYSAKLSRGDHVTLSCTGSGMVLGSPILKDCEAIAVILTEQKAKIEQMANDFFAGAGARLPERMRFLIGFGYATGLLLPADNACEKATADDMEPCRQQFRRLSPNDMASAYLDLAKHFPLPARTGMK